ncbi:DUF2487 family protein [Thalassobacillus sp. CUG 92003]|uniref:DUF2487 family protein n=1 Tax=Thalassobacillus sp. CUG 92003 TaxID=2736641 RepID=UPI0015E7207F|nr:DUF2487 family protein [Thalassobacillus sp. CUG 92003]
MLLRKADVEQYVEAKEYIDTLVIPLIPFEPSKDADFITTSFQVELTHIFTRAIEKEYRGRIFLGPDYYYLKGSLDEEIARLNQWVEQFEKQSFQHIFLFTVDSKWKKVEKDVNANLLWVPGLKQADLQSTETQSFIQEQARQITELIQAYW